MMRVDLQGKTTLVKLLPFLFLVSRSLSPSDDLCPPIFHVRSTSIRTASYRTPPRALGRPPNLAADSQTQPPRSSPCIPWGGNSSHLAPWQIASWVWVQSDATLNRGRAIGERVVDEFRSNLRHGWSMTKVPCGSPLVGDSGFVSVVEEARVGRGLRDPSCSSRRASVRCMCVDRLVRNQRISSRDWSSQVEGWACQRSNAAMGQSLSQCRCLAIPNAWGREDRRDPRVSWRRREQNGKRWECGDEEVWKAMWSLVCCRIVEDVRVLRARGIRFLIVSRDRWDDSRGRSCRIDKSMTSVPCPTSLSTIVRRLWPVRTKRSRFPPPNVPLPSSIQQITSRRIADEPFDSIVSITFSSFSGDWIETISKRSNCATWRNRCETRERRRRVTWRSL